MERTIDRTSYRRSLRSESNRYIKETKNKKFNFIKMFLDQIIISMLIIILILVARFFDITIVEEWITANMSNGMEISTLFSKIRNEFENIFKAVSGDELYFEDFASGDLILPSGDYISGDTIEDKISEVVIDNEDEISEDAKYIKTNYDIKLPLIGTVTSRFGNRVSDNPIVSSYHEGIDIAADTGTNFVAAHNGTVILAENYSTYGKCIMIEDENLKTVYAHCSNIEVKKGQKVNQGDIIGKVGMSGNATGPHLHFEIRLNEKFINPEEILGEI